MARYSLFSLFLFAAAWQDSRRKEIQVWIFWIGGMLALMLIGWQTAKALFFSSDKNWLFLWMECVAASLPGIVLLFCGNMTRGAVGVGDGWFFLISGWFLGLKHTMLLLCGSVFLCGGCALVILCQKRAWRNVHARKITLPFLPFTGCVWLGMLAAGWIFE